MTDQSQHRIRLLMVVRVVAVTALLMAAFLVELWFQPTRSLTPLYLLTAAIYVLTIIYGLLESLLRERPLFVWIQLSGDVLACTAFVYMTGGASSLFSFLYIMVIIAGGILLFRRGALVLDRARPPRACSPERRPASDSVPARRSACRSRPAPGPCCLR